MCPTSLSHVGMSLNPCCWSPVIVHVHRGFFISSYWSTQFIAGQNITIFTILYGQDINLLEYPDISTFFLPKEHHPNVGTPKPFGFFLLRLPLSSIWPANPGDLWGNRKKQLEYGHIYTSVVILE